MPSKEDLLLNLHLKRGEEWVVGADANVAAWQHALRHAVGLATLATHQTIVDPVYAFWAKRRYDGLYGASPEKTKPQL